MSTFSLIAAGTAQDTTVIKVGQGWLQAFYISNKSGANAFVKLYDKATAPATTDTPLVRLMVPAGGATDLVLMEDACTFGLGLGVRITALTADNDNTGVSAADVIVNIIYR